MAIYHNEINVVGRSSPRSTLAISAYINRNKTKDYETEITYDFSKRKDLIYSEILLPENAPEEYRNKEKLWNAVEKAENGNGQTARTLEIALPRELNSQEQIKVVQDYVKDNFVKSGMCADIALHDKGDGNPHAHIMLTMRPINAKGEWDYKSEKVYLCKNREGEERAFTSAEWQGVKDTWEKQLPYYRNGSPNSRLTYLTKYEAEHNGRYKDYKRIKGKRDPKNDNVKVNPLLEKWNSEESFTKWREDWAAKVNRELERKNLPDRIDHRSYEEQGIEKNPTIHMGAIAAQYEKMGVRTRKGNINRAVKADNEEIEKLNHEIAESEKIIKGIHQDNSITRIHELTDEMKSALNNPITEQKLIQCRKLIETLNKQMKEATAANYNENRFYTVQDSNGENKHIGYIEYHREKYERDRNNLMLMVEYKRIAAKEEITRQTEANRAIEREQPPQLAAKQREPINSPLANLEMPITKQTPPLMNLETIKRLSQQQPLQPEINEAKAERETPPQPQPNPLATKQQAQPQAAVKTVNIRAVAADLEEWRSEYISIISQIKSDSTVASRTVNPIYQVQINQITDTISEINKLDEIIHRAEREKSKLKFTQGREKREKQSTIDRGQEQREKHIDKLKELGVGDIGQSNVKISELQRKADAERNKTATAQADIKALQERKSAIQREYKTIKNSFSEEKRAELEQYQSEYRSSGKLKSLDMYAAEIQAYKDLETSPPSRQEQSRNRTRTSDRDDR